MYLEYKKTSTLSSRVITGILYILRQTGFLERIKNRPYEKQL